MKIFINWKYTIVLLSLLGSLNSMPISNDKAIETAIDNQNLEIEFNNSVSPELPTNNLNIDKPEKENEPVKGIYGGDVVEKNDVNIIQKSKEKEEVKENPPEQQLPSDNTINDKSSKIIVDNNITSHQINNPNKVISNDSKNNNDNNSSNDTNNNDDDNKGIVEENTTNMNDNNNYDIDDKIIENNNETTSEKKSYIASPDNSNSYELEETFDDTKKAIYASGVIMGILLFFVVGNFVMRVKANCEVKNPPTGNRSLSIDSFEIGIEAENINDINSLLSLETMEQYSENSQAYVIDNDNKKKNIAKIYEIKGIKDHIFTRPSNINQNESFNSLFRLSTNGTSINDISTNDVSTRSTVSLNTLNTSYLY